MKKLFLVFSLIGVLGCAREKAKRPAGLLPETKMISLLADIHIAESRVEAMRISPDTSNVIFKQLQREILQKHNVPETEFNKTYDFYLDNIAALDKLYEGLVDTLGMREIKAPPAAPDTAQPKPAIPTGMLVEPEPVTEKERKIQKINELRKKRREDSTKKVQ